jgi:hypothetical protein
MPPRPSTRCLSAFELLRTPVSGSRRPLQIPAYRHASTSTPTPTPKQQARPTSTAQPADALPVLPRPLGVPQVPSTKSKTWKEKKAELLDEDRHKAKRKAL